ncbi:MAG TPA: hypothetical protein VGL56_12065 [Fimbriimonadaceae bacterium]|jgi:hypothetical protein
MLALLAAVSLVQVAYTIPSTPQPYTLDLKFDGFIGLFGLINAKAEVQANLVVKAEQADSSGNVRASTNLDALKVILNGSIMPFTKDGVAQYFPNTVTLSPQGKVLKSDSPDVNLPIHLPGLDIKRFPALTFLAIEFPKDGIQEGTAFSYTREFQAGPISYTVTPRSISTDTIKMDITLTQDYDELQDESNQIVKDAKDAVNDVKTHVTGTGAVEFDRKLGLISKVHINADAAAKVTNVQTKEESKRDLKTTMDVTLANPQ